MRDYLNKIFSSKKMEQVKDSLLWIFFGALMIWWAYHLF
jgi:uncharacterized protein with PQ loop repeat